MMLHDLIKTRVSQKTYLDKKVDLKEIEEMLDISVFAPNHKMREPWRFIIVEGKQKEVLTNRYLSNLADDQKDDAKKKLNKIMVAPCIIAFVMPLSLDYDDEIEDIQANAMAMQNFLILANEKGLSTHVKTPLFIKTDLFKEILKLNENEIITALVMVGYADQQNSAKRRTPAKDLMTYYE